jgi:hypothetical protein
MGSGSFLQEEKTDRINPASNMRLLVFILGVV